MIPTTRPKLEMPRTPVELVLDAAGFLALLLSLFLVIRAWGELPERIPHHFDILGKPDAWGGRWTLLLFPGMSLVLFVFLGAIRHIPERFNYLWPITEQNAARQYRIAISLITVLRVEVVVMFLYLTWCVIESARNKDLGIGPAFLPILIGGLLVTIGGHLLVASRAQ